jgi:small neutral amino acid transporter SnatA (MarC family)
VNENDFLAKLVKWIVCSDQPFMEVDSPEFCALVAAINPKIKVPGRATVTAEMHRKFTEYQDKLKLELKVCLVKLFAILTTYLLGSVFMYRN